MNPLKPATRPNRLKAARGQSEILVDDLLRFSNDSVRLAFVAHLNEELPEGAMGAVFITEAPDAYDSPGEPGMIAQDGDYLYVYTGNGETVHQWPRMPLAHGWT